MSRAMFSASTATNQEKRFKLLPQKNVWLLQNGGGGGEREGKVFGLEKCRCERIKKCLFPAG